MPSSMALSMYYHSELDTGQLHQAMDQQELARPHRGEQDSVNNNLNHRSESDRSETLNQCLCRNASFDGSPYIYSSGRKAEKCEENFCTNAATQEREDFGLMLYG